MEEVETTKKELPGGFQEGQRVRIKGTKAEGIIVAEPENSSVRFYPWLIPVKWDRNPDFVNAVPYTKLEIVPA